MTISTAISNAGKKVTISISGKFDFHLYDDFRLAYAETPGEDVEYEVNLAGTEYLDSSALGMLLLLREHAGGESSKIDIVHVSKEVQKILDVANFSKLFNI